jgi:hypothetical protein
MQETFMSDSEDEGGKTALIRINCMVSDLVKDECIHLLTCGFSSLYVTQCYRSQVLRVILLTNSDTRVKWLCVFILWPMPILAHVYLLHISLFQPSVFSLALTLTSRTYHILWLLPCCFSVVTMNVTSDVYWIKHTLCEIWGFHSGGGRIEVFWVVMLCSVVVGYHHWCWLETTLFAGVQLFTMFLFLYWPIFQ